MTITFEGRVPPVLRGHDPVRRGRMRQLAESGLTVLPGAYDCISARLVEKAGFNGLYLTGSGMSMSALGAPDVSLMSFGEVLDQVKRICDCVEIPVMADADTGYGGPLNVIRTVREFERAGVSAIQIEDQTWPKKCGHEPDRRVVDIAEMTGRIKAAADARSDRDMLIVARTDARSVLGLSAAIDRAGAYVAAGADVVFVESPESEEELRAVAASVDAPLLANMVEGGRTPILPAARLEEIGYRFVIYPNAVTRAVAFAAQQLLGTLKADGSTAGARAAMFDHRQLWDLFDYPSWVGIEAKYAR
ncbi:isocitrate lyase/PEP mutase family protein [Bosea thiooxidans]|nr:oxaloacetate decarboxylase [Bosea sp. (in: a-proteobacteria)]